VDKLIITAAITGSRITTQQKPHIPLIPEEIADSVVEAHDAGAAIVHIHMRDPKTGLGTPDVVLFKEVLGSIRQRCNESVSHPQDWDIPCRSRPSSDVSRVR